ncbi:MAG: 5'-nucleotidase C-terminal domain-containing protein [Acidobacteria bacterium]|nr:5'-nucleotidase C-terminal domain-containing protein [Acidobacteriota bacterium]
MKRSFVFLLALLGACRPPATAPAPAPKAVQATQPTPPRLDAPGSIQVAPAIEEDPELKAFIAPRTAEVRALAELPLVEAPQGLFRGRSGEEHLLGYWICDAVRTRAALLAGTDVAFAIANRGGIRANLKPGMLKVGDIFEVMPFENEVILVDLTGAELIQVLREGLQSRGGEPISGVKVTVAGTPDQGILSVTWADGRPIDPKATVRVATSDYLYGSGDSMPTLRKGRNPFTTGLTIRQVLLDACKGLKERQQPLLPPPGGRYVFSAPIQDAIAKRQPLRISEGL